MGLFLKSKIQLIIFKDQVANLIPKKPFTEADCPPPAGILDLTIFRGAKQMPTCSEATGNKHI